MALSHRDSQLLISTATERPCTTVSIGYYGKLGSTQCAEVKDLIWKVHRERAPSLLPSPCQRAGSGVENTQRALQKPTGTRFTESSACCLLTPQEIDPADLMSSQLHSHEPRP